MSSGVKAVARGATWALVLFTALISPIILVFGVPLAIGVGTDVAEAGGDVIAGALIAIGAACLLRKLLARGWLTAPLRAAVPPSKSV